VLHDDGSVRLPALDNHTMGTIFEELIRRFNEENNEEAGEHFTPRDVVELMADLIFLPIADKIKDSTYSCYDGASGTGGMLTVSRERLLDLAERNGKDVSIHLFGQEINPETYAITRADMLLKGEGSEAENIAYGSTLSDDRFPSRQFDFMLSNPPYGKSWKNDAEKLGGKKDIIDPRFVTPFVGDGEFAMLPSVSDGQLLFLLNNVSKMKEQTELGSRIAEVHNGSSLFTGDAGEGESNVRRCLIERDLVEAIIALPENMFYNTGIGTYIWVLSNRKDERRRGKIQLIDATALKSPLRKNLGNKNCELTPELRHKIAELFLNFEENEYSKIFDNSEFGYWKITVERPLRLAVNLSRENIESFEKICERASESPIAKVARNVAEVFDFGICRDYNTFMDACTEESDRKRVALSSKRIKLIRSEFTKTDPEAAKVIKVAYTPKQKQPNTIYGLFDGKYVNERRILEYEPDTELRDTEQIPLKYGGGIGVFFKTEVLPYAPDAWIDGSKTKIGYEISFTKYFYKPVQLRTLEEITADLRSLEKETEGLLYEVLDV
jgi:type I restriction enzyme M protein